MLAELLKKAKSITPEKRQQLVDHVTGLFVQGAESYRTEEIAVFNTILEAMLSSMETGQKQQVAEQLSEIDTASHKLAVALARDNIDIATPMLTQSDVLKSDDLLKLARTMGQGHLLALSKRKHLEAKVTDVLLERGEQPVKRSVASNSGAEFSEWGAKLLLKLAEGDEHIRDALMERTDITEADLERLISHMPAKQQTQIRKLREQNEELLHDLFQKASRAVTATKLERKATRINAKVLLKEIRDGQTSLGQAITQMALSNNLFDICFLLAEVAGLDQKYVTNVMVRYDATGIAVLCRALGLGETDYKALSKARASHNKQPATTIDNWVNDYETLSARDARRMLSFMKIRLSAMAQSAA